MATYQDYALEKDLVRLEEEVKQLKANQVYGIEQNQMFSLGEIQLSSNLVSGIQVIDVIFTVTGMYPKLLLLSVIPVGLAIPLVPQFYERLIATDDVNIAQYHSITFTDIPPAAGEPPAQFTTTYRFFANMPASIQYVRER